MKKIFLAPLLSLSMTLLAQSALATQLELAKPHELAPTRAFFEVAQVSIVLTTKNGQEIRDLETKMLCKHTLEFSEKNTATFRDCEVPHKGEMKKVTFLVRTDLHTNNFEGVSFETRVWDWQFMLSTPMNVGSALRTHRHFQTTNLNHTGFVLDSNPEEESALVRCMAARNTPAQVKACADQIGEVYIGSVYIK